MVSRALLTNTAGGFAKKHTKQNGTGKHSRRIENIKKPLGWLQNKLRVPIDHRGVDMHEVTWERLCLSRALYSLLYVYADKISPWLEQL
jgi:hypothetical protein